MRFYASAMPLHPTKCEKGPRIASRPSKKDGFSARSTDGAARLNPSERWTNRRAPRWVQLERMLNRTSRASGASASTAASSDLPSTASGCFGRPSRNPSGAERFDAVSTFPRSRRARMRPSPRIGSQPAWGPKQSPEPHLCYIRRSITRSRRRSRSERAQPRRRLAQTQQPRQRHSCAQVSHSPRQPQR